MQSNSPEDDAEGAKHTPRDAATARTAPPTERANEQHEQHEPGRATAGEPAGERCDQTAGDVLDRAPVSEPSGAASHETAGDFVLDSGPAHDAGDTSQVPSDTPFPVLDALHAAGEFNPADAIAAGSQSSADASGPSDDIESNIAMASSPVEIDLDPLVEPAAISSDGYEPSNNADDADPRSQADLRPVDSPEPAAAATTFDPSAFDTSAPANLSVDAPSADAPVEDVNFRRAVYISGRDADGAVDVPFPSPERFDEAQPGTPPGVPARAAEWSPRASALLDPTADGGPPLARPSVLVTLSVEQTRKIVDDALTANSPRAQKLVTEIVEEKVNEIFWQRDCEMRAVWGK
jgi:hypothetical protein